MPTYTKNPDSVEDVLAKQVIVNEVQVAQENLQESNDDLQSYIDLLDAERSEKQYDWMSDIRIPEFVSHMLTQSAVDVSQYFQTRDFVEVYLEDGSEDAILCADSSKELLNRTLNQRHLYHYAKFVRAKFINNLCGRVYIKCWWEQATKVDVVDWETKYEELDVDQYGDRIVSPEQTPAYSQYQEPVFGEIPVIDRFNYDVWDQRNVFTDKTYTYSLQQKPWVTLRSEMTLGELRANEEDNEYFDLDKLEEIKPPEKSETAKDSYEYLDEDAPITSSIEKPYDIYERHGAFWTVVDKDEDGNVVYGTEKMGIDVEGKPLDNAEMHETVITVAVSGARRVLIGFKLCRTLDANGIPYRPIIRGLCYIHPSVDAGTGDGKYSKELQIAIDDTFNISQDRVMLATLPTIKTAKHNVEDNSTLYFEPGHRMEFDKDPDEIQEFKISDDIGGALGQIAMLTSKMQQADAVQPPSLGQTGQASTTATAFAGASYATGERSNYKSMTFEQTALCELYWMIQQMTYQFAHAETAEKLMGEKAYDFDPTRNYYYKPVSQAIEPEYSKNAKIQILQSLFGYTVQLIPIHPDGVRMVNDIYERITKLMGDEYANIVKGQLDESKPLLEQGGGVGNSAGAGGTPVSNQNGIPMSGAELGTRGIANIGVY